MDKRRYELTVKLAEASKKFCAGISVFTIVKLSKQGKNTNKRSKGSSALAKSHNSTVVTFELIVL